MALRRRPRLGRWRIRLRGLLRWIIWRLSRAVLLCQASKAAVDSCCPVCSHGMRPKDHPVKFMLFVCSSCGHEKQLDFEFSWRRTEVNGIRVLSQVKHQGDKPTCVFFAIATALEAMLKYKMAQNGENFHDTISTDDMIDYFDFCVSVSTDPVHLKMSRKKFKVCQEMLQTTGVLTNKAYKKSAELLEESDYVKIKDSVWHQDMPFEDICELVLQGNMLVTMVRMTKDFGSLGEDEIYECARIPFGAKPLETQIWHALVIVGFGIKDGKNYFRVQNSHGSYWADSGFGMVSDSTVEKVLQLVI